jgi:hypothetical protein
MMQNDPKYTFDLTKIEVTLYQLVKQQVSSKMILFCIKNVKIDIAACYWKIILKFPINDDIIEYITPYVDDARRNPVYLSKCRRNSVAKMVKLGYMMPARFCVNCIEIKRCLEDYVMPLVIFFTIILGQFGRTNNKSSAFTSII